MALPHIRIGVQELVWHGAGCMKGAPNRHYIALEDVAEALNMPIKELCRRIGRWQDNRPPPWAKKQPDPMPLLAGATRDP